MRPTVRLRVELETMAYAWDKTSNGRGDEMLRPLTVYILSVPKHAETKDHRRHDTPIHIRRIRIVPVSTSYSQ